MGATATPADPARTAVFPSASPEARQTGGVTTRLILDYVEREGGREAVEEFLRSAGLQHREQELRNEDNWSSYATKIAMLERAAQVLKDPLAARHIGEAGMDFNVAPGLKLSLRALGSLRPDPVRTAARARESPRLRPGRRRHVRLRAALAVRRLAPAHGARGAARG